MAKIIDKKNKAIVLLPCFIGVLPVFILQFVYSIIHYCIFTFFKTYLNESNLSVICFVNNDVWRL